MIRACRQSDFESIRAVINDAAAAYKGTVPPELYREPWMSVAYLESELRSGVAFWCMERDSKIFGVMGVQRVHDVLLIRHSYVCTELRRSGIGSQLIRFHLERANTPILVGCLKAMTWAIRFYQKHGFILVGDHQRDLLRRRYWNLSPEHVRNSVVLVDARWIRECGPPNSASLT